MPVNPADGPVLGTLYGTDAMRACMGEHALLARMLEVEAALARAQARLGVIRPMPPRRSPRPPTWTGSTCRRWPRRRATRVIRSSGW
jgi:hypothetical protein